jgi:hypothetical protein
MAIIKKKPTLTKKEVFSSPEDIPSEESSDSGLSLPTELSEPVKRIEECTALLFGEKKIGKTSLASQFDKALFLMFEPGGKGLRIYQRPVNSWLEFKKFLRLLESDKRFNTVVIDTIDIAYDLCFSFVCRKEGVKHPSELPHGQGWNKVETEFVDTMNRLIRIGKGVVFISHAEWREFEPRDGAKYTKVVPSVGTQARRFISGVADMLMYYGYYGSRRFITIAGSDSLDAGHRLEEQFWTADGKKRVHSVSMGSSAKEGYENLVRAFNNEQATTGEPEISTGLTDTPAKRVSTKR